MQFQKPASEKILFLGLCASDGIAVFLNQESKKF
jgi:hypothetical protein